MSNYSGVWSLRDDRPMALGHDVQAANYVQLANESLTERALLKRLH